MRLAMFDNSNGAVIRTYRYRVKDKHAKELARQARAVNFVWNWCNERQKHCLRWGLKWLSAFDLMNLSAGASSTNLPA